MTIKTIARKEYIRTPQREEMILQLLGEALPKNVIALACNVPQDTILEWITNPDPDRKNTAKFKQDAEFARLAQEAEAESIRSLVNGIRGHGSHTWVAFAWLLERQYPEQFSLINRTETKVSGSAEIIIKSAIPRPPKDGKPSIKAEVTVVSPTKGRLENTIE